MKRARLNIRWKIAIGYILVIFFLGVSIVVVTGRIAALQNEIGSITSTDIEVHNLIASTQNAALLMETGQRGYLLTGTQADLETYNSGKSQWEAKSNSLSVYLSQDLNAQTAFEEIKVYVQGWIFNIAEPTILLKQQGQQQELEQFFAQKKEQSSTGMAELRNRFESLHAAEIQATKAHVNDLANRNRLLTIGIYVLLFVVIGIGIFIVTFVSGSIAKTIRKVAGTIADIASAGGNLKARIQVHSNDEIRDLGEATNELLNSLEIKSWIQTRVAEVATMSQGINDLSTLGQTFLSKVAPMIQASYGVFYIRRHNGMVPVFVNIASYAGNDEPLGQSEFGLGEGLIGQCALDNRIYLLNGLQEHQATIRTAIGVVEPRSMMIVPIAYENRVEAVVEFASLESFSAQHLRLIEEIESDFGIAVNHVAGRMEVERLLSESQGLAEELQAQTEELQLYSAQLQQSSQYKTNFLANMSHELRTPLNSILILSQMLADNEQGTLNEEEAGYARVIHASGNDLLKLINDILDLSKVEAGKIVLTVDEVNLTEFPELMRQTFDPIAEKKGIRFDIESADDLPPIWRTDGQRLQQIIKNLLSNAFKFSSAGSVTLSFKLADRDLVEQIMPSHVDEQVLAISVRDTGIGIARDKQKMIFEAFQQVDGETNRLYGGTGLGLSICSEFSRLLYGKITVDSSLGKGSVFTFYLPELHESRVAWLSDSADEEVAVTGERVIIMSDDEDQEIVDSTDELAEEECLAGKKVLIVDDDARNVYALVKALERKRMHTAVAGNGVQCMERLLRESDFDLILMDMMMPIMDGAETIRAIRQHAKLQHIPILALTAKAMPSDRDNCLAAGATDYISKPIDMQRLFELIRQLCKHR